MKSLSSGVRKNLVQSLHLKARWFSQAVFLLSVNYLIWQMVGRLFAKRATMISLSVSNPLCNLTLWFLLPRSRVLIPWTWDSLVTCCSQEMEVEVMLCQFWAEAWSLGTPTMWTSLDYCWRWETTESRGLPKSASPPHLPTICQTGSDSRCKSEPRWDQEHHPAELQNCGLNKQWLFLVTTFGDSLLLSKS